MASQPSLHAAHGHTRLEVELEFVQCLANPFYLNYLAHTKVLDDGRFIKYIEYLEYFRNPDYPVYSLSALTLLKQPQFRMDIANPGVAQEMMQDMVASFLPPNSGAPGTERVPSGADTNGAAEAGQSNGSSS